MGETVGRPPDRQQAAWRKNYAILLTLLGITGLVLLLLLITVGVWWKNLRGSEGGTRIAQPAPRSDPPVAPAPLPVAVVPARTERQVERIVLTAHPNPSEPPAPRLTLPVRA